MAKRILVSTRKGLFDVVKSRGGWAVKDGHFLGDTITLVSPHGAATPFGTAPRSKPYQISTIFELGMSEYDRMMIFMPLAVVLSDALSSAEKIAKDLGKETPTIKYAGAEILVSIR